MRKIAKIIFVTMFLITFAIPCFASNWAFLTKTSNGTYYLDTDKRNSYIYGGGNHPDGSSISPWAHAVVRFVPSGHCSKRYDSLYKQHVNSVVQIWDWECRLVNSTPEKSKVYNINGKFIGQDRLWKKIEDGEDICNKIFDKLNN